MSADQIQIQISANVAALVSGMNDAVTAVTASLGEIQEQVSSLGESLDTKLGEGANAAKEHLDQVSDSSKSMGASLDEMKSTLNTAFAATGIGFLLSQFDELSSKILQITERAVQMRTLSAVTGLTTAQIQALSAAADETGVQMTQVARGVERFNELLTQARAGSGEAITKLHELGITNAEIADKTFSANDMLQVLHTRLTDGSMAATEMQAVIAALGPRYAMVAEALVKYIGTQEGVNGKIREVNGLNDYQVERLSAVAAGWKKLGTEAANASAKMVVAIADAANKWQGAAHNWTGDTAAANTVNQQTQDQTAAAMAAAQAQIDASNKASAAEIADANGVSEVELNAVKASVELYKEGTNDRVVAAKAYAILAAQYYGSDQVAEVRDATKQELEAIEAYQQKRLQLEEQTTRAIETYNRDRAEATKKEIDQDGTYLQQQVKTVEEAQKAQLDAVTASMSARTAAVEQSYKLGQISAQEEYAELKAILDEKLAAEYQYAMAKAALDKDDPAAYQADLNKMAAADAAYNSGLLKNATTVTSQIDASYKRMAESIASSMSSAIMGMINGTETFRQAMLKLGESILQSFISNTLRIEADHIAGEAAQTAATAAGVEVRTAAEQAGATKTSSIGLEATMKQINTDAMAAAAATYHWVATIPYIGWLAAPAAAAAAYAGVMAFGTMASAADGYVLPSDMMVSAHANEMILPSNISQGFQNMFSSGNAPSGLGGGGSSSGGNGGMNVTFQVQAMDQVSINQFFQRNGNQIAQTLATQYRLLNKNLTGIKK